MTDFSSMLPKTDLLEKGLARALHDAGFNGRSVTLLDRAPTPYSTTFPCEIVTCKIGRRMPRRIFCKYTGNINYTGHGHRGGVGYESEVYRDILAPVKRFRPKFYGAYVDKRTNQRWLFLEYLDGSLRVGKLNDVSVMERAAQWIARFHAANEAKVADRSSSFLKKYDKEYYLGWVRRTNDFAGPFHRRFPWLRRFCLGAGELLTPLLMFSPTIIHGEYYHQNVLLYRRLVCPIDWESAAVGEGLIDLVALTEGWGPLFTGICKKAYVAARWPSGPPAEFEAVFRAARLYLSFRWLGDEPEATRSRRFRGSWKRLHMLAKELNYA